MGSNNALDKPPVLMGRAVADEFADTIQVVRIGVEEAARTTPPFDLKEAVVSLNVASTNDGKVQVVAGGGVDAENAHLIKLTLAPPV